MNSRQHFRAFLYYCRRRATRWILGHRMRARHPTLASDPTAIWDYAYSAIDDIEIGLGVSVCAFSEILVYRSTRHSRVRGRLVIKDGVVISTGTNIRAAGGTISIGPGSGIGQQCILVAANHGLLPGIARFNTPWDEMRCGIEVGSNVWVGAASVLLPGCTIGDNAVVAANSVVRGAIPAGELWAGVPARFVRQIESPQLQDE